jgi:formamidopyrimidine-DNA glycosylase
MPELPEVETIARALAAEAAGRTVAAVHCCDPSALAPTPEAFAALVSGRRIEAIDRRGKLLVLNLSGGAQIGVHLRMTGRLFFLPPGPKACMEPERPRAVLELDDGSALSFSDVRRFGSMTAFAAHEIEAWPFYKSLGPEPFDLDAAAFSLRLGSGAARIKARLLDQTVIAGVGNIYADESLFRAGIRPDAPTKSVSRAKRSKLFAALIEVLALAIAENGSSIRDYRDAHGDAGAFQNHFRAYGRAGQPCTACGAAMQSMRVAGRTSTYCPRCQPARG